jgi:hypothetical protein
MKGYKKIICIDNGVDMHIITIPDDEERNRLKYYYSERLTIGRIYLVIKNIDPSVPHGRAGYNLIDDLGNTEYYLKERFIPLEQHREQQLNKIL